MNCADHDLSHIHITECPVQEYSRVLSIWESAGLLYRPKGRDSIQSVEREIEFGVGRFFIARLNGEDAGCVLATHDGRKGWINRCAVKPRFRRKGIAAALIRHAEAYFDKTGISIVTCLIEGWNKDSMSLFRSLGYTRHDDIIYFSKRKNKNV